MSQQTIVYYYISISGDNPVRNFLDSLSGKQQAKILRIFQHIREYGLQVALPHVKKLSGTDLWEIRILGKNNIRVIYVIATKDQVLVLHGFVKKTNKTPRKEIKVAKKRWDDWQGRIGC